MKRTLIVLALVATALLGTSCLEGGYASKYTTLDDFEVDRFLDSCPDSVFCGSYFVGSSRRLLYNIQSDKDHEKFTGGFVISWKRDHTVGGENEKCNQYCVLNSAKGTQGLFGIYFQNDDPALNPDKGNDIVFIGGEGSTCSPTGLFVANTAQIATLISRGSEDFEPFKEGDYLRVVFTGYNKGVAGNSVTVDLAKFAGALTLVNEWKKVELAALGSVTSIDVHLETNRDGLPLAVCIDDVMTTVEDVG